MNIGKRLIPILLSGMLMATACGAPESSENSTKTVLEKASETAGESGDENAAEEEANGGNAVADEGGEEAEKDSSVDKSAGSDSSAKQADSINVAQNNSDTKNEAAGNSESSTGQDNTEDFASLPYYEKLCGKYSSKVSEDECYTLEIVNVGANLYAMGGSAYAGEGEVSLSPYSFWAMELFPENPEDLTAAGDECKFGIMTFSIMSNMGEYWSPPGECVITVNTDGLIIENPDGNVPFITDSALEESDTAGETADSVDDNVNDADENVNDADSADENVNDVDENVNDADSAGETADKTDDTEGEKKNTDSNSIIFNRDDRVEDTFPYMPATGREITDNEDLESTDTETQESTDETQDASAAASELTGLWKSKRDDIPMYLEFRENGLFRIYEKTAEKKVFLGIGNYEVLSGGTVKYIYNILGNGHEPIQSEIPYIVGNDEIIFDFGSTYESAEGEITEGAPIQFTRADEKNIPLITVADVYNAGFDENRNYDEYHTEDYTDFYGIWVGASKNREEADELLEKLKSETSQIEADIAGESPISPAIIYSPDWDNLNKEPYYCVTVARCETEEEADSLLEFVKKAGYKDAYVKFSGDRISTTIYYTVYKGDSFEFYDDKVIINDVITESLESGETGEASLVVDAETVFDENADTFGFANYYEGELPLDWFLENRNSDNPMDLMGVFEVKITGNHIDSYLGSYWWD